jgi:hypothetical protein
MLPNYHFSCPIKSQSLPHGLGSGVEGGEQEEQQQQGQLKQKRWKTAPSKFYRSATPTLSFQGYGFKMAEKQVSIYILLHGNCQH